MRKLLPGSGQVSTEFIVMLTFMTLLGYFLFETFVNSDNASIPKAQITAVTNIANDN